MRIIATVASFTLGMLVWAAPSEAQTAFVFDNWRGYFTVSNDGKFKACFAQASYSSGDTLQFWLTPEQDLYFGLRRQGDPDPNQKTARIWVDEMAPTQANIENIEATTIFAVGRVQKKIAALFEAVRMGNVLFIEIGGTVRKFSLRGTYGALSELMGCARLVRQGQPPTALALEKQSSKPSASRAPVETPKHDPTLMGTATAFAVSSTGHFLTNAHAVEACREVRLVHEQDSVVARVIAVDKRNDLALLDANGLNLPPVPFRRNLPRLGEAVYAFPAHSVL